MQDPAGHTVTLLLRRLGAGEEAAFGQVIPLVYDQLLRIARRHMRGERTGHTLEPTALVHEAYARLAESGLSLEDRGHFFAVASRAMRRILVDHARGRRSRKRDASEPNVDVLELDEALTRLAAIDERKARVVELHYFGGLSYEEISGVLSVSPATVDRDLRFAKAWLHGQLDGGGP